MLDVSALNIGDSVQVTGGEDCPKFFHVPGHKSGFVAMGMVGTVCKLYRPGESDHLDRSDERDVIVEFTEPKKWKAHFMASELALPSSSPPLPCDAEDRPDQGASPAEMETFILCEDVGEGDPSDRVECFMTPAAEALVLSPQMPMLEAAQLLSSNLKTGAPVADGAGRLVGVLTQFDFLYLDSVRGEGGAGRKLSSKLSLDSGNWAAAVRKSLASTVAAAMSKPVAVSAKSDMQQVAQLMLKRRFNHVPIVADDGMLVGILTSQDVLRHVLLRMSSAQE